MLAGSTLALLRVDDPALQAQQDILRCIKRVLALQCVYVTGCCQRTLSVAKGKLAAAGRQKRPSDRSWPAQELVIGFIGCGLIGGAIAHSLLDAGVMASSLIISTRSPKRQLELSRRGARVLFDNASVVDAAHVVVLSVLPSQLADATRELRGRLSPHTLVLSVVGGTPVARLRSLLGLADTPAAVLPLGAEAALPLLHAEHKASPSPLADRELVQLAARALLPDREAVSALLSALGTVVNGVELPAATPLRDVCLEALFGPKPAEARA